MGPFYFCEHCEQYKPNPCESITQSVYCPSLQNSQGNLLIEESHQAIMEAPHMEHWDFVKFPEQSTEQKEQVEESGEPKEVESDIPVWFIVVLLIAFIVISWVIIRSMQ